MRDSEHEWALSVKLAFLQLVSLTELQSWVKKRRRVGAWIISYHQALTTPYQSGNGIGGRSALEI